MIYFHVYFLSSFSFDWLLLIYKVLMWFCRNCDCLEIDHFSCKICLHVFPTSAFSVYVVLIFCRYVFCYPCVYDFVKEYGKCPVTNYPARTDHLIKLYLDSSWWTDHQNFIWTFQMNWSSYKTLFRQLLINRSSYKTSYGQFWKPFDNKKLHLTNHVARKPVCWVLQPWLKIQIGQWICSVW